MVDEVDPRLEAEAQIARALQICIDASEPVLGESEEEIRAYTPDELETLFFSLSMAMVQLMKLTGGKEARDRFYANATDVLAKRGRQDILEELKREHKRKVDAKEIVKRAFGDNVDFSIGTSGHATLRMVELDLHQTAELREKLIALVESLG